MKKIIIVLSILIIGLCVVKEKTLPQETIRFRIIANSNSKEDQDLKKEVVKDLYPYLSSINYNDINKERSKIKTNLPLFENIITEKTDNYTINYGYNYFPEKEYKGKKYPEGEYESLVITLGNGEGRNFWCILFPPLCMVDEQQEKIEYKSLIKEVINKYF